MKFSPCVGRKSSWSVPESFKILTKICKCGNTIDRNVRSRFLFFVSYYVLEFSSSIASILSAQKSVFGAATEKCPPSHSSYPHLGQHHVRIRSLLEPESVKPHDDAPSRSVAALVRCLPAFLVVLYCVCTVCAWARVFSNYTNALILNPLQGTWPTR